MEAWLCTASARIHGTRGKHLAAKHAGILSCFNIVIVRIGVPPVQVAVKVVTEGLRPPSPEEMDDDIEVG